MHVEFALDRFAARRPSRLRLALRTARFGGYVAFEGWVREHNEGRACTDSNMKPSRRSRAVKGSASRRGLRTLRAWGVPAARTASAPSTVGELAVWVGVSARTS